jgi:hypothetical protein
MDPENFVSKAPWCMPDTPDPNTGKPREINWWNREGDTFETVTLSPSISVRQHGEYEQLHCWHGFIRNGEVVN